MASQAPCGFAAWTKLDSTRLVRAAYRMLIRFAYQAEVFCNTIGYLRLNDPRYHIPGCYAPLHFDDLLQPEQLRIFPQGKGV